MATRDALARRQEESLEEIRDYLRSIDERLASLENAVEQLLAKAQAEAEPQAKAAKAK
jgi:hypothetical protein